VFFLIWRKERRNILTPLKTRNEKVRAIQEADTEPGGSVNGIGRA
jgi:hypothetical protein